MTELLDKKIGRDLEGSSNRSIINEGRQLVITWLERRKTTNTSVKITSLWTKHEETTAQEGRTRSNQLTVMFLQKEKNSCHTIPDLLRIHISRENFESQIY